MKLRMRDTFWMFVGDGFRCKLEFGKREGKHDEKFIPVVPETPLQDYYLLYREKEVCFCSPERPSPDRRYVQKSMPAENAFQVVKVKKDEGEAVLLRPHCEGSHRVLLFIGKGMRRGEVELYPAATTGKVLAVCRASNEAEARIEVAVILEDGQTIAFNTKSEHYHQDDLEVLCWNGEGMVITVSMPREQWETRQQMKQLAQQEGVEVL